ncbi:protein FAM83B [Anguilla anguilla]|uniref:protein FAM83B n=1 Tax=Anguilla anguilla TaxID=7936 RepID=UPI0015B25C75|nr:protein FAM83B [Anguilla anguilla]
MESQLSLLSSLNGDLRQEDFIQPHYKESYRIAIDTLVSEGQEKYQEVLKEEQIGDFLSEREILFIKERTRLPVTTSSPSEEVNGCPENTSSSGTYWPMNSDVETPDLDLGWPECSKLSAGTNIELLFHPPRLNSPTIKEVIRKQVQDARQVIAVAMDMFTDADILKELADASARGVAVYILLDDFGLQSFLTMAEKQDVQIQRLRNMRVRTVKGHEYLCRSGARFHGAMEQKFLLVDCQTVLFGSYSFTWSFEKIHLSMVQVITGQLVQLYDEEFRTLFARSTVPAVLCPAEGRANGHGPAPGFKTQCGQAFERSDQLRHTLDTVYMKACGKGVREEEPLDRLPAEPRPAYNHGANGRARPQHLQPPDALGFLKRHSYAGERQEASFVPTHPKYGASNWNVSGEGAQWHATPGRNEHFSRGMGDPLQVPKLGQVYGRGNANLRQSFHGNDKHILSMQQNLPSLDRTTKSFLRTWRIESYLNNKDVPLGESTDYLDQYEALDSKPNSYMSSRLRSSIIFTSTIPEQPETNSNSHNSSGAMPFNAPAATPFYSSMQWQPTSQMDNRMRQDEYMMKRRSLQILEDPRNNLGIPGRDAYHTSYTSLGRAKGGLSQKSPDVLQEDMYKRHSVADPRMNMQYSGSEEPLPRHGYGLAGRGLGERRALDDRGAGMQRPSCNLKEDKRSVSHYNVKEAEINSFQPQMWQEPPSRTVSVSALSVSEKEPLPKSPNLGSPRFFKKSTKKIKSLLNIPEKKGSSSHNKSGSNLKAEGSSDTLISEDQGQAPGKERGVYLSVKENHFSSNAGKSSSPRFSTEDLEQNGATPWRGTHMTRVQKDQSSQGVEPRPRSQRENHLYTRFEPFCALEKKQPPSDHLRKLTTHAQASESSRTVLSHTRGSPPGELYSSSGTHTHTSPHDNKLGRFIQRVGHLLHKNK